MIYEMNSSSDKSSSANSKEVKINNEEFNENERTNNLVNSSMKLSMSLSGYHSMPRRRLVKAFSLNTECSDSFLSENNPA